MITFIFEKVIKNNLQVPEPTHIAGSVAKVGYIGGGGGGGGGGAIAGGGGGGGGYGGGCEYN